MNRLDAARVIIFLTLEEHSPATLCFADAPSATFHGYRFAAALLSSVPRMASTFATSGFFLSTPALTP